MGIKLKGRTLVPLNVKDYEQITDFVRKYKPQEAPLFKGPPPEPPLGKPREDKVMLYEPTNEQGVVALFVGHMKDLGFERLDFIQQGFPDACALQELNEVYTKKYIEFEFNASQFRRHEENPRHRNVRCDYVVCWENDYPYCPVKCIELRTELDRIHKNKS